MRVILEVRRKGGTRAASGVDWWSAGGRYRREWVLVIRYPSFSFLFSLRAYCNISWECLWVWVVDVEAHAANCSMENIITMFFTASPSKKLSPPHHTTPGYGSGVVEAPRPRKPCLSETNCPKSAVVVPLSSYIAPVLEFSKIAHPATDELNSTKS